MNGKMDLGGYHILIVLAAMDGEIIFPEVQVINKYINDRLTDIDFDPEAHMEQMVESPESQRLNQFNKAIEYVGNHYSRQSGERLYVLAKELIEAKGFVNEDELQLYLQIGDAFDLLNEGYSINVPIIWSEGMKIAFKEADRLNNLTDNLGSIDVVDDQGKKLSRITLTFAGPEGKINHEIVFDGSKTNYIQASKNLRGGMDHIKNIAQQKSKVLLDANYATIKGKDNIRFSFLDNEVLYFVIADMRPDIPSLNYVGCSEWDYHLEDRFK